MGSVDFPENSLLNGPYREYLKSRDGYRAADGHDSADRETRRRLRGRIRRGIADFNLLNHYIRDRDLKQIFDKRVLDENELVPNRYNGPGGSEPNPDVDRSDTAMARINVTHAIAVFWRGLRLIGNEPYEIMSRSIFRGVQLGEAEHKGVSPSDVYFVHNEENGRVDVRVHDSADLDPIEKWSEGLPLTLEDKEELDRRILQYITEEEYLERISQGRLEKYETDSREGVKNSAWVEMVEEFLLNT